MERSTTSRSAALVVLARAHLTWMGIIDDPFARQMLPANLTWVASALRLPGVRRLRRTPSFAYLAARTLFFDRFVVEALMDGIGQVVVIAAGYDSRAWRMARPEATFFEIDLPSTQADKRSRAPTGAGPVYVASDATGSGLAASLEAAGFRPGAPSAFTVEGLTMYLSQDQVTDLLTGLAELGGPGARLAVNFGVGFEQQGSRRGRIGRRVMAAGGEAFRFRLPPADAEVFLAETGWRLDQLLTGPQLRDGYLGQTELASVSVTTTGFAVAATQSG